MYIQQEISSRDPSVNSAANAPLSIAIIIIIIFFLAGDISPRHSTVKLIPVDL